MDAIGVDPMEVGVKEWLKRGFEKKEREILSSSMKKPKISYEKLEDISPEVFEDVLFGERESPDGWRCSRGETDSPSAERDLWHQIVARALTTGDYRRVALVNGEFAACVLDDLSCYVLTRNKPLYCGMRHVIVEMISDGRICIITLDPGCVAIYA